MSDEIVAPIRTPAPESIATLVPESVEEPVVVADPPVANDVAPTDTVQGDTP